MTTENWFEALTAELLTQSPFRRSEYFTRFASGALSREQVWAALLQHYGARPEWGGMNYTVHEAIEKEESGETKKTILKHLRTPDDRRAAEDAMREMHRLLAAYAQGLARRHLSP